MTTRTAVVSMGRARLPLGLAAQLTALPPKVRGRVLAFVLAAHVEGVDLAALVAAATEMKRLGVLLNQSLRASGGRGVDVAALQKAIAIINSLQP